MLKVAWNLWRRYWFDLAIVAIATLAAMEVTFRLGDTELDGPTWLFAPWAALFVLPLLARRRFPFGAPATVFAIGIAGSLWNGALATYSFGNFLGVITATFLFGMLYQRERSAIGLGIAYAAAAFVVHNDPKQGLGDFAFICFTFTIAWLAGLALGGQLRKAATAIERAERAEQERELRALAAVADERARIARELHDIVGHSVSVMTVQASAVRRLLRPEQEREREALLTVEETGRAALAEMRRLVGVLRRPEDAPALVPQPSLEYVEKLVQHAREAGLATELRLEGEPTDVPQGVDLTAYRLVQEGLTNALKHANATRAEVIVRYDDGSLELVVRDNGTGDGAGGGGGTGSSGSGSAWRSSGASSRQARGRKAATSSGRCSRWPPDEHPRPDRGRPGARADRLPHDPRGRGRHRGRGRGGGRRCGGDGGTAPRAGRGADGRAHARARRHRGDAAAAGRRRRGHEGRDAHHLRHGRVRVRRAAAGASGFLLKDVPPEQLIEGIRAVANGDALLAPSITRRLIEEFVRSGPARTEPPPGVAELTTRELEVLRALARGLSNAEIAKELFVSETTVKTHVAHVLMKLQLRDRVQAVVLAYESGLVQPGASPP